MNDIVEPGAFKKTLIERGPLGSNRIRVLWQHGVRDVIGIPLVMEEHGRDYLPDDLKKRFKDASGGLFTRTQLVMDVQRGREAFALYKSGAMNEWSIGFNSIDEWFEEREKVTFRHLREIRLWEYSPVTWGANEATTTVAVKGIEMILQETILANPALNDLEILRAVEKRLKIDEPAEPVLPLTATVDKRAASLLRVKAKELELRLRGKI